MFQPEVIIMKFGLKKLAESKEEGVTLNYTKMQNMKRKINIDVCCENTLRDGLRDRMTIVSS